MTQTSRAPGILTAIWKPTRGLLRPRERRRIVADLRPVMFLGESLMARQSVGVALTVVAAILLSYEEEPSE
jgi:hypothetical protein